MIPADVSKTLTKVYNKARALAYNLSDTELKVLDATNEEPWGPTGPQMKGELARGAWVATEGCTARAVLAACRRRLRVAGRLAPSGRLLGLMFGAGPTAMATRHAC